MFRKLEERFDLIMLHDIAIEYLKNSRSRDGHVLRIHSCTTEDKEKERESFCFSVYGKLEYPSYDQEEEEEAEDDDDDDEGGGRTMKEVFKGATCNRCGEEIHMYHMYYYKCTSSTCDFSLHKFCAELPIRICGHNFFNKTDLWIYKCDKCMYYAHLDCATSRREPFMSILMLPSLVKNYKDADHPHLLHLPFPDETYSVPRHLLLQQEKRDFEVSLNHASHPQHPLVLVDQTHECDGQTSSSSSLVMCHDPMKKTQLLCNGCLRPITSTMPFYMCPHLICNFALHEWCTRLPSKIENHPSHPQHPLLLKHPNDLPHLFGVFRCAVCRLPCNGFAYGCVECKHYVDVTCAFIPPKITHKAHPNHLLSLVLQKPPSVKFCHMCCRRSSKVLEYPQFVYNCNVCDIYIHTDCALFLAETIRHKYDKHPMHLSYLPIENHKSEYFCEICEEDLNPLESFYHCKPCVQSIHAACAPLILQSETETYGYYYSRFVYTFVNVKFGGILNSSRHQHPLSFAQGLASDGKCVICRRKLLYRMIFKCLKCKSAICYSC